jgi:dipeptidyl aminopeptidase/acylaminoacyl peptidase
MVNRRQLALVSLAGLAALGTPLAGAQGRWREQRERRKAEQAQPPQASLVSRITTLKEGGGRLDWVGDKIAFDMMGPGGFFATYVMRPDGSGVKCLSCDNPDLPKRNVGQPAWDPSGRYLALQAEKAVHRRVFLSHTLTPGAGILNDLWVLDTQTNRATLVREVPDAPGHGILHPHFSADGQRLSWSEMTEKATLFQKAKQLGCWELMVADFKVTGGRPSLSNIRSFSPGGPGFYENHGFSPDGSRLIFTSNFAGKGRMDYDIYSLDLGTQKLVRLTNEGYNEHANFSPDGQSIVWMSNVGVKSGGSDYWIMNSDGSNKRRLTYFNESGHPEYRGKGTVVADLAWRPDGSAFAAYTGGKVIRESATAPPRIVLVELHLK